MNDKIFFALVMIIVMIICIKYIKSIWKFIKNNHGLTLGFVIALVIFISYEITMDWPEIITNGDFYYNLFSQLSLAYMGSFIFYIIQVYIPKERDKKAVNKTLIERLIFISELMIDPTQQICNDCLGEGFRVENLTVEQWEEIAKTINFNRKVSMTWTDLENISCLESILTNIKLVDKKIDKIYISLGIYLDIEIVRLLEAITNSSYHLCFPIFSEDNIGASFYVGILKDYSELNNRLMKYIKNLY